MQRPCFDRLPLHGGDPPLSAWGLWGAEDELGTLNMLDAETVKAALNEVIIGERIPVNLALDAFVQPMNPVRKPCQHHILTKGHANDDEIHINTQGASHWDGLRHYPYQETKQYYNGVTQDEISGPEANNKIGIQNLAHLTVTGRGVLIDWYAWKLARGSVKESLPDPFSCHAIPLQEIQAAADAQNLTFRRGDILFIRTGWLHAYRSLTLEQQAALPYRAARTSIGLEASEAALRWHWDQAFAAVASDTVAYEAWPSPRPWGITMHETFLSGWGMPIGESLDLEVLAERCKERGRWSFFFVSVPLNVNGGVASPTNAVAIL